MVLPSGQAGALNRATRGFAVAVTTGVVPVTSGVTMNAAVRDWLKPDVKSLATT